MGGQILGKVFGIMALGKMKIKTHLKFYLILVRMAITMKASDNK